MNRPKGFSIIELLVVMAIIGILLALAIPALQSARESARRTQCLNNMHQIGIALHNYNEQFTLFPPSMVWSGPPGEPLGGGSFPIGMYDRVALGLAPASEPSRVYANWLVMLLPGLGQDTLFQLYDPHVPVSDTANADVRSAVLPVLNCPSDTYNRADNMYRRDLLNGTGDNRYARGNYAMNMGPDRGCLQEVDNSCSDGFHVDEADLLSKNMVLWGSGIGGVNKSFKFRDMVSGTSYVIGVDEIRAGISAHDPRGTWSLGFIGASATARHGLSGGIEDATGPNHLSPSADDIVGCHEIASQFGIDWLVNVGMPCWDRGANVTETNDQATSRSMHPGGVLVLAMDGSARFVGETINPDIWYHLHKRDSDASQSLGF